MGVLHPGAMGAAVGSALRPRAGAVVWAAAGRSDATSKRAELADLVGVPDTAAVARRADVIVSVCPPHAALDLARAVAALRFSGLFVDANAVSPSTAREIGGTVEAGGAVFVDGGLIGPPPRAAGTTRLYLSGREAKRASALFDGTRLEAIALSDAPGAASALKMAYAAYTKGVSALLIGVRALAAAEGVDDALLAEWHRSQPDLPKRSEAAARDNARKAWRFVGEMEEITAAFEAAGLPGDFHEAAAEIYRRLAVYKDATTPPSMADLVGPLTRRTS